MITRITEIIAALFILLFVYTAVSKLTNFNLFYFTLQHSPLSGSYAKIIALALPVTELVIAGLLFIPRTRMAGLYLSFVMMIIFTLYIGGMIMLSSKLPCSCGGVLKQMTWKQHLVFNVLFILLAGWSIWLNQRYKRFIAINRNSRTPV